MFSPNDLSAKLDDLQENEMRKEKRIPRKVSNKIEFNINDHNNFEKNELESKLKF